MLAVSSTSATTRRKTIARALMESVVCFQGHTSNQTVITIVYGICEKYLLFKLYHCFLTYFTVSLTGSLTSVFTCSVAR